MLQLRNETPNIGKSLEDFKKIHFSTVKAHKHFDLDENERPYFQAEVMVMTFIPKKYIINLDTFLIMIYIESRKRKLEKIKRRISRRCNLGYHF